MMSLSQRNCIVLVSLIVVSFATAMPGAAKTSRAQDGAASSAAPAGDAKANAASSAAKQDQPPPKVDVVPIAQDDEISNRLERILNATGWFQTPDVHVQEGVVFLEGTAQDQRSKDWAGDLARNTQDVVAVVNQMHTVESSIWDFGPALDGTREIWKQTIGFLPFFAFGLLIAVLSVIGARLAARVLRTVLLPRMSANLLADVLARAASIVVLLLGLYIVLRVSGLTRLALTVLGGTGLFGLVLGIAFRDITENFLASIFLSLQHPFRVGDLVEISGVQGYVQRLNIRSTVLMTLTGNHVQIPNSTVYKSTLYNFTSNPNRREDFSIAIGLGDSLSNAQDAMLKVLKQHPAVLQDPEPWVLADGFTGGSVNLRVYFWINGAEHSWLKVRSSVMRLAKQALQEQGMLKSVDQRERFFPRGLEIHPADGQANPLATEGERPPTPEGETKQARTAAEGGLRSEATQIEEQARQARSPEDGENLLKPETDKKSPAEAKNGRASAK